MGFGMSYYRGGEVIEIIIRDNTGKKLEQHKINAEDKKLYLKIINYIESKYGLRPTIEKKFGVGNAIISEDDNTLI